MKSIYGFILFVALIFGTQACKNDATSVNLSGNNNAKMKNDAKALEGTGVSDISETYQLNQSMVIQPGNVGFNFKTANTFNIYISSLGGAQNATMDFDKNHVFAIFAEPTIKETFFKVEGFDNSGEQPVLEVKTIVSENTVTSYRPSFITSVPRTVEGFPIIRLDGTEIPVFIVE